jgi:hypothetical protein
MCAEVSVFLARPHTEVENDTDAQHQRPRGHIPHEYFDGAVAGIVLCVLVVFAKSRAKQGQLPPVGLDIFKAAYNSMTFSAFTVAQLGVARVVSNLHVRIID